MDNQHSMDELHWIMDMVQTIDAGLVVLDKNFNVQLWNGFMSNHSGLSPRVVQDSQLFSHFPELPETWLNIHSDLELLKPKESKSKVTSLKQLESSKENSQESTSHSRL